MIAKSRFRQYLAVAVWLRLLVVTTIFVAQLNTILSPPAAAAPGVLQTIGDFLSLGANTARELQKAIELASGEMKEILRQLKQDIEEITDLLEKKFQDNLNYALSSLDATTWNILLQLEGQITTVNELLREDIRLISQEAQKTIRFAGFEIRRVVSDLEQSLQRSVLFIGITGAFLIDRATHNGILIIAIVMLGLGLLVFIWLLFTRRIPSGLARNLVFLFMAVYLALFVSLTIPPVRGYAMTFTGVGLEQQLRDVAGGPRVIEAFPDTIVLGETQEVNVWGSMLRPEGKMPTATVAGIAVPVKAAVDIRVVVDVADLEAPEGSTTLTLLYDGREGPAAIVTIVSPEPPLVPAELEIADFAVEPPSPVENRNTQATIVVCNQGGSPSPGFVVQWKPTADHPGLSLRVPSADVGECPEAFFPSFAYPSSGTFETIAIVDVLNEVDETNEADNSSTRPITVQPEDGVTPTPKTPTRPPRPACPPSKPICCEPGPNNTCRLCIPRGAHCP